LSWAFFGAKRFGDERQRLKNALIFDTKAHRYEEYISDIKGVDIKAHSNNPLIVVEKVCSWLKTASRRRTNQEYKKILDGYPEWKMNFDNILIKGDFNISTLTFNDYCLIVEEAINSRLNQ
jgi:hypothetical protein